MEDGYCTVADVVFGLVFASQSWESKLCFALIIYLFAKVLCVVMDVGITTFHAE